ncbi:parB-like partition protein [Dethiosulfovibrio peptidovorans DSM 11002]|uniref:ParB-like partition protein n=1 Tax=Dethiosulfovibrio peptidovorans DSM 11002 TaxID=469381 RepID=D2Z2X3_9BACT|nr:ParB/RepB/Spo0J family partition protein [Dethiosulfovibrio peptidovorans]EFC90191.1 parB-like partition protein [Dethiosulfovibrio peptidovorans DSM 11002]
MKDSRLAEIELSRIRANPYQPRKHFDEDDILELAESIGEVGLIQPLVVRPSGDFFELIAGERRLRACLVAGLEAVSAIVLEVDSADQQIMALVENIHRKDLSSIEEAGSLKDILDRTGWGQSELARRLGRSQASVANKLRLLKLEEPVQKMVMEGLLGERSARALLRLPPALQIAAAKKVIDRELTSKEVEELVNDLKEGKPLEPKTSLSDEPHVEVEIGDVGEGFLETVDETDEGRLDEDSIRRRNSKKKALSFNGPEGPTGELLHQLADLVEKQRKKGIPVVWKVRELAQSELVVEIIVDLKKQLLMEDEEI